MMTDTVDDADLPYDKNSASQQEKVTALQERLEVLEARNEEMHDKLLDTGAESNKYQQRLEHLAHEDKKLKQSPLFVTTVQEITDKGVIIKQHGNNQETLTGVTGEMHGELKPDARAAVDNSLSIVRRLDKETDVRARAIQVEHSPGMTYGDISDFGEQMQEVRETVKMSLDHPEAFAEVGIDPPSGVLLYGPLGTGKTVPAKAVVNRTNASFIKTAGSELARKFIGEDVEFVRNLFEVARENEPIVIFVNEIDAIALKRANSKTSSDAKVQRMMMQLLAEMDGFDGRGNTRIIAATSRFDMLDPTILRPGRFDRLVRVLKPSGDGREIVFQTHTRKMNVSDDVDFVELAEMADSAPGADIRAVCTEAGMFVIRNDRTEIFMQDFVDVWEKTQQEASDETEASHTLA